MIERSQDANLSTHSARYEQLRMAFELFWGIVSSATLAMIYFPAAVILWYRLPEEERSKTGHPVGIAALRILPVLAPVLATPVAELINVIVG